MFRIKSVVHHHQNLTSNRGDKKRYVNNGQTSSCHTLHHTIRIRLFTGVNCTYSFSYINFLTRSSRPWCAILMRVNWLGSGLVYLIHEMVAKCPALHLTSAFQLKTKLQSFSFEVYWSGDVEEGFQPVQQPYLTKRMIFDNFHICLIVTFTFKYIVLFDKMFSSVTA